MGNQKVAARRKPTAGRSGTRKSSKENNGSELEPPSHAKKPYPKARPTYKKVASIEDSAEEAGKARKGEAEAAAALVSMQNRSQTGPGHWQSAFDSEFTASNAPDDEDLNEPSEDEDVSVEEDELEEDQLDKENKDEGKRRNFQVPVILP